MELKGASSSNESESIEENVDENTKSKVQNSLSHASEVTRRMFKKS